MAAASLVAALVLSLAAGATAQCKTPADRMHAVTADIVACKGSFTDNIGEASSQAVCGPGWHVCQGFDSVDFAMITNVTYAQATSFGGCYVFDSANDCNKCHTSCVGGYRDPGSCLTSRYDDPDLAAMGSGCPDKRIDNIACLEDGRVDIKGHGCGYSAQVSGVVCCQEHIDIGLELDGSFFAYVPKKMTWQEAAKFANGLQRDGVRGHLMVIASAEEQKIALQLAKGQGVWVGGYDGDREGHWTWEFGEEAGEVFWIGDKNGKAQDGWYTNWRAGVQPDNAQNGNQNKPENCLYVTPSSAGYWDDLNCDAKHGFLVEFEQAINQFNGHLYEYVDSNVPWEEALAHASRQSVGLLKGHLVTIESAEENSLVQTLLQRHHTHAAWTGALSDSNQWNWVASPLLGDAFWNGGPNGMAIDGKYTNWHPNEPNTFMQNREDCGEFYADTGTWNDLRCDRRLPYIIEYEEDQEVKAFNGAFYSFISSQVSWQSALAIAATSTFKNGSSTISGSLVSVADAAEYKFLMDFTGGQEFWLGGRFNADERKYQWTSGNLQGQPIAFVPNGESLNRVPSNTKDACLFSVDMDVVGERWQVETCGTEFSAFSEVRKPLVIKYFEREGRTQEFGGHNYELREEKLIFPDALYAAELSTYRGQRGHLVTISSAAENEFVHINVSGNQEVFMAGSDADQEGTWRWLAGPEAGAVFYDAKTDMAVDGRYVHFMPREPNNVGGGENYLSMYGSVDAHWDAGGRPASESLGFWNDASNNRFKFVVEYEPSYTLAIGDKQYVYVPVGDKYEEALYGSLLQIVDELPGHLLTIESAAEFTTVQQWLAGLPFTDVQVWLGAKAVSGKWVTQTGPSGGQPATAISTAPPPEGSCVMLSVQRKAYTAALCTELHGYVIEFEAESYARFKDHFYRLVKTPLTWGGAVTVASTQYYAGFEGHIVTVESAAENVFLAATLGGAGRTWIGAASGVNTSVYDWAAGPSTAQAFWRGGPRGNVTSPRAFAAWAATQPSVSTALVCVDAGAMMDWASAACDTPQYTIVEYEPRELAPASSGLTPPVGGCSFSLPRSVNIPYVANADLKTTFGDLQSCLHECCESDGCVAVSRNSANDDLTAAACFLKSRSEEAVLEFSDSWNTYFLSERGSLEDVTMTTDNVVSAEERVGPASTGSVDINDFDIDLPFDFDGTAYHEMAVALYFRGAALPPNAAITAATVQFTAYVADAKPQQADVVVMTIAGELSPHAATPVAASANVTQRARTAATVEWKPRPWAVAGQAGAVEVTADFSAVVQELVRQPGWTPESPVVVLVTNKQGTDVRRRAVGATNGARPVLSVTYQTRQLGPASKLWALYTNVSEFWDDQSRQWADASGNGRHTITTAAAQREPSISLSASRPPALGIRAGTTLEFAPGSIPPEFTIIVVARTLTSRAQPAGTIFTAKATPNWYLGWADGREGSFDFGGSGAKPNALTGETASDTFVVMAGSNGAALPTIWENGHEISRVPGGKGGDTLVINAPGAKGSDCEVMHVEIYATALHEAEVVQRTRELISRFVPCPTGQYEISPASPTSERKCAAFSVCAPGEFIAAPGTPQRDVTCSKCAAGTYDAAGGRGTSCTPCKAGTVTPAGQTFCSPCDLGEFYDGEAHACLLCPAGTFTTVPGQLSCAPASPCRNGTIQVAPATESSDTVCKACPRNQFADQASMTCKPYSRCTPGTAATNVPSSSADRVCAPCPAETFNTNGQGACTTARTCSAVQIETAPPTATSNRACRSCGRKTFKDGTKCTLLTVCGSDQYEMTAPTPTSDRVCVAFSTCPAGTFVSANGTSHADRTCTTCTATCPSGSQVQPCTMYADLQCSGCTPCATGTFGPGPCATECQRCVGCTEGVTFETTQCSAVSNRVCTAVAMCSAEQYETQAPTLTSNRLCHPRTTCPATTFESDAGNATTDRTCTAVTTCEPGQKELAPATATSDRVCGFCNLGESLVGNDCVACVAGQYPPANAAVGNCSRYSCPPGTFSPDPLTDCQPCGANTFASTAGAASCAPVRADCPAGKYTPDSASPTPTSDRVCLACAEGTFKPQQGNVPCTPYKHCGPGEERTAIGTNTTDIRCGTCPVGQYLPTGVATCVPAAICPRGEGLTAAATPTTDTQCASCVSGSTYKPVAGNSGCQAVSAPCAAGEDEFKPSTSTDRLCIIVKPGPAPSPSKSSNGTSAGLIAGIVVGVVLLLVLVAVAAFFLTRSKGTYSGGDDGMAADLVNPTFGTVSYEANSVFDVEAADSGPGPQLDFESPMFAGTTAEDPGDGPSFDGPSLEGGFTEFPEGDMMGGDSEA